MAKIESAEALIDRVRAMVSALPGVTERLSHGEPAFFVRKRCFVTVDNGHHGSGHVAVWCNAPSGVQESLVTADPKHFFRPPYVGVRGWVGVRLDSGLDWKVIADLLRQAHEITGARRKQPLL